MTKIQFFLFILILGFLTGPRVMQALQKNTQGDDLISTISSTVIENNQDQSLLPTTRASSSYASLQLESKSIYVWDIQSRKKLFGINDRTQLPLASVTKIMTALVASETLTKDSIVIIRPEDLLPEGDSGLYVGEMWKFNNLLAVTLLSSSNDGASAIANTAGAVLLGNSSSTTSQANKKKFVDRMNAKALSIGLEHTTFFNESGLDTDVMTSGAYGSTRDMAMLFDYIYYKHPELFNSTTRTSLKVKSEDNILHHYINTNTEIEKTPGLIASKTGYTDLAGGNLVVIVNINQKHPIVISVLGSTKEGRFSDVAKLINASKIEIAKNK